eukprot:TRINITY_DN3014_c3_g1_i1.p1 TRINITY_DN3014_c3_g1~~TRINITY_DN3014_c3_g1_i1.p1  ORF type:complete len:415 (+),score=42.74 TRINITY_DN3014_c3_g1_i1:84-1328(+)
MCTAVNAMLIDENGGLYGWGSNSYGELGLGNNKAIVEPTQNHSLDGFPVEIALGYRHSVFLNSEQTLYSCGKNHVGQLGHGTRTEQIIPTKIDSLRGNVTRVACGEVHSLALLSNGALFAWGNNSEGQLGLGDHKDRLVPTLISGLVRRIVQMDCGGNFSVALTMDGMVYSWGYNPFGELGIGNTLSYNTPQKVVGISNIIQVSCGCYHALALSKGGEIYGWGYNQMGELGIDSLGNQYLPVKITTSLPAKVVQICCGRNHSMALLSDGSLYSWGNNTFGQLGMGQVEYLSVPTRVDGIDEKIIQIKCGCLYSMAITASYHLYCWGSNANGELGDEKLKVELVPKRIQPKAVQNNLKIYFEKNFSSLISLWPHSHSRFSLQTQVVVEDFVLTLQYNHVPKDVIICLVQTLLQVL